MDPYPTIYKYNIIVMYDIVEKYVISHWAHPKITQTIWSNVKDPGILHTYTVIIIHEQK
jgi:hypothetical protein